MTVAQYNPDSRERAIFAKEAEKGGAAGAMTPMTTMQLAPGHKPSPEMRELADSYNAAHGFAPHHSGYDKVNEPRAKRLADHFVAAPHEPTHPEVKGSYDAMKRELTQQHDHIMAHGIKFERYEKEGQPYANSDEMVKDVRENHHLYFFPTESGFGEEGHEISDHPLMEESPRSLGDGHPYLYNDMLRAVHDTLGHAVEGYQFGPRGEDNAFKAHASMFTPAAHLALANETRAQNSYVNFGPHLRNPDGSLPKPGDANYIHPADRPYADQKVVRMPKEFYTDPVVGQTLLRRRIVAQYNANSRERAIFAKEAEEGGASHAAGSMRGMQPMQQRLATQGHTALEKPDSGFSVDIKDGHSPQSGYMVAHRGTEQILDAKTVSPEHLHAFIDKNRATLSQAGTYFGGWHNPKDGKVYLDVSDNISTHEHALQEGVKRHQLAIYDLSVHESEPITPAYLDKYESLHGKVPSSRFYHAKLEKNLRG